MSHAISLCCILRRSCSKISSFHCSALKTDPGERSPHTCSVRGPRSIFMSDHCRSSLPFESHLRNRLPPQSGIVTPGFKLRLTSINPHLSSHSFPSS